MNYWDSSKSSFRSKLSKNFVNKSRNFLRQLCPNLMNLSRVSNLPKTGSIERRLKSWKNVYNFNWNQSYLSRGLNLSRDSNSASGRIINPRFYLFSSQNSVYMVSPASDDFKEFLPIIPSFLGCMQFIFKLVSFWAED